MSSLHFGSQVASAASQWLVRAGGGRTVAPPSRLGLVALSRGNAVASSIDIGRECAPGIAPDLILDAGAIDIGLSRTLPISN